MLRLTDFDIYDGVLSDLDNKKLLINTINAHSFNISKKDENFQHALKNSDVLIPDGISIVIAMKLLLGRNIKKIAGADLFYFEMNRINSRKGKCFFLGSNDEVLKKIKERAVKEFPNVTIEYFSPPYRSQFYEDENKKMIELISNYEPDVLFVGMTAPKQEKWTYSQYDLIKAGHICCIGAVFDFYAGTKKRAPRWMIGIGLEWLYRLFKEPKRLWRRYVIGNVVFLIHIFKEKIDLIVH